ncbi:MAG: serine/threonine protein kinase [Candidatus Riflebacteria bacterium]|nr:serine/threonine protein kinase [Candidatus Riflebacteria bacterium]
MVSLGPPVDQQQFLESYQFVRILGAGAYGKVYLARQHALNRLVAIKVLTRSGSHWETGEVARFVREARLLASLAHPRVLPVFDAGSLDGTPYLVMEYIEGSDLAGQFREQGRLSYPETTRIGLAIAQGLEYLHGRDVIHRDLKPGNVLLGNDDAVKISDFGLARPLVTEQALTAEGVGVGTPIYMAPEVIGGAKASPASDLYSLGTLLYELCHGDLPYPYCGSMQKLLFLKVEEDAPPPARDVPPGLAAVISGCLARKPEKRPDARRVRELLERAANSDETAEPAASSSRSTGQPRLPNRTRRLVQPAGGARTRDPAAVRGRTVLLGGGAVLVVLSLVLFWLLRSPEEPAAGPSPEIRVPLEASGRPSDRAGAEVQHLARLEALARTVRSSRLDWMLRWSGLSGKALQAQLDRHGLTQFARDLKGSEKLLAAGGVPTGDLARLVMPLLLLRHAAAYLAAHGSSDFLDDLTAVNAAFPFLAGPPRGADRLVAAAAGLPVTAECLPVTEMELTLPKPRGRKLLFELPAGGNGPRRPVPAAAGTRSIHLGPGRAWWVMEVRDFCAWHVMDVRVRTPAGPRVFTLPVAMAASDRPLGMPGVPYRYSGILSLGFDGRLLAGGVLEVTLTYIPIRGPRVPHPLLARLELWQ